MVVVEGGDAFRGRRAAERRTQEGEAEAEASVVCVLGVSLVVWSAGGVGRGEGGTEGRGGGVGAVGVVASRCVESGVVLLGLCAFPGDKEARDAAGFRSKDSCRRRRSAGKV